MPLEITHSRTIEDMPLDQPPGYLQNPSGNAYLTRTKTGDLRTRFLRKVKTDSFYVDLTFNGGSGTYQGSYTYTHNLGYTPIVLASLRSPDDNTFAFAFPFGGDDVFTLDKYSISGSSKTVATFTFESELQDRLLVYVHFMRPPVLPQI